MCYLSNCSIYSLSDMSPATSDCLEPYSSVFLFFSFPSIPRRVLTFLGPLFLLDFSQYVPFLGN